MSKIASFVGVLVFVLLIGLGSPAVSTQEVTQSAVAATDRTSHQVTGLGSTTVSEHGGKLQVIVEIDCSSQQDMASLSMLLDKLDQFESKAVVFVAPVMAEENGEVVKGILQKGHQLGVLGDTDISQMTFDEQVQYLGQAFSTVRSAANAPESVIHFKPYEYKFNQDTFEALRAVHAKSISGVFPFNESYCKCWYARSLGKITFPYPVDMDMIAVPISEFNGELLDSTNSNLLEDAKLKLQEAGFDPVVLSLEPSKVAPDKLEDFLTHLNSNGAKVDGLPNPHPWITNLNVSGPNEAYVGQEISLTVSYTSTKWCPHYRFRIYGKYEGQNWKGFDNKEHCYFVRTGHHSFTHKIAVPEPPDGKDTYTVRVVGRASYGGCGRDWPRPDNAEAVAEMKIKVNKPKLRVLFVPVNWAGTRNFDDVVQNHVDYFFDEVPLGSCPEQYKIDKETTNISFQWPPEVLAGLILWMIETELRLRGVNVAGYDRIVGLTERSPYLDGGGTAGIAGSKVVWVSTETRDGNRDDSVTAHELGHTYGLADEYCSVEAGSLDCRCNKGSRISCGLPLCIPWSDGPDANPLNNPQADCWGCTHNCPLDTGYERCCWGNAVEGGGRCIMAAMGERGPRHFCHVCRQHLASQDQLQCDSGGAGGGGGGGAWQKVINIGLLIGQDDSVAENYVEIVDGIPTSSYVTENFSGNYTLQIATDNGVLWSFSFNPQFYYYGPVSAGRDYSNLMFDAAYMSLSIPYTQEMTPASTLVELYHDELLIFSRELPIGAISGEVTANNGEPVKNALVEIAGQAGDSTYTDENGTYNFTPVNPGYYTIHVYPDPYDNLMEAMATTSVSIGDTVTVNFSLQPAGTIAGEVTSLSNQPLENIHFHLGGYEPPIYRSDENGTFVIPYLNAGNYRTYMIEGHGAWYQSQNNTYTTYGDSMPVEVTLGNTTWVKVVKIEGTDYATVTTSTNTGDATVVAESGYLAGSLRAVDVSEVPDPPAEFPHGLFSFQITGLTPGREVTVTLVLPSNLPEGACYWKYHAGTGWYQIPIGSNDGDNIITITLQDGGIGDDDGVANGVIVDVGGPSLNQVPIAHAGSDQTVSAVPPATTAMVTLDGSGSYDPDGDPLTYTWMWNGNVAHGVSPTVELPLGTTTITLVVNDGKVDSEPDTVDVTVLLRATIDFRPKVLRDRGARRGFVSVYIELPRGFDVRQIDIASIRLNGVVPASTKPTRVRDYDRDRIPDLMVKFGRAAVLAVLTPGDHVQIAITGEVAGLPFCGTDTIRVIKR